MEREEGRNSNIEVADTTVGRECDRVANGDDAEEYEGNRIATIETINGDIMDVEENFPAAKRSISAPVKARYNTKGGKKQRE